VGDAPVFEFGSLTIFLMSDWVKLEMGRSRFARTSNRSVAVDAPNEYQDHGEQEEYVNESTHRVRSDQSERPKQGR